MGAGGANVWTHQLLSTLLRLPAPADSASPYKTLPEGAGMRVSIRRTLRVGEQSGSPLEDLGVLPDVLHQMTKEDLLEGNTQLIGAAADILQSQPVRVLDVVHQEANGMLSLDVTTGGLNGIDIYVDDRPVASFSVADGLHENITLDLPGFDSVVSIAGFAEGNYVAARKFVV